MSKSSVFKIFTRPVDVFWHFLSKNVNWACKSLFECQKLSKVSLQNVKKDQTKNSGSENARCQKMSFRIKICQKECQRIAKYRWSKKVILRLKKRHYVSKNVKFIFIECQNMSFEFLLISTIDLWNFIINFDKFWLLLII